MISKGQVDLSIEDSIAWITINRPEIHNALSQKMWDELKAHVLEAEKKDVSVIVVRGQGTSFASGADLKELKALTNVAQSTEMWNAIATSVKTLAECSMATIAMVDGPCIGGGLLVALACDMRIASKKAILGLPVARLGIILDQENVARLERLVGSAQTKQMMFSAATIGSERALAINLVNEVVERDDLLKRVTELAKEICANSKACIKDVKRTLSLLNFYNIDYLENSATLEDASQDPHIQRVIESYLSEDFRKRINFFS